MSFRRNQLIWGCLLAVTLGATGWAKNSPSSAVATTTVVTGPSVEDRLTALEAFFAARVAHDPIAMSAMNSLAGVYVARARLNGDESYYRKAEGLLERSLKVTDSEYNLDARVHLAGVRMAQHRFREAREMAEQVLALHPKHKEAIALIGDALLEQGDLKGAGSYYDDLLALSPGVGAHSRVARLAEKQGRRRFAEKNYAQALTAADQIGGEPAAWIRAMIADFRIKTGDYDEARIWLQQALDIVPGYYLAFQYLAEIERREGNYDSAHALLQKSIARGRAPESLLRLAKVEEFRNNPMAAETLRDLAIAQLEATVAQGGQGHLRALANALLDHHIDAPRALLLAEQDLGMRQGYEAQATMARALAANGELLRACVHMNAAIANQPLDPDLYLAAAEIYGAYGDQAASEAASQTAFRINPRLAVR